MHALRRFEVAEAAMRERSAQTMQVSENELLALRYVIRRQRDGEPVTPTDIAHYLGTKSAAVTIMIDHLERAGHLQRRPHPTDRRSLVLEATETASARIDEIFGAMYDTMMGVARQLEGQEADRIMEFLDGLATSLDGFVADGEPTPRRHTAEAVDADAAAEAAVSSGQALAS
ncbi:MAG: MarR family transcriptional regulator [Microbacterium sp.]|uniref:MarR family winged helix-turn-helix transcriptional regulator n=1 Tax=Microbacterium sp. TaxID=51671 RepID=UPI002607B3D1|nr:MarR family transcriptional regulator [Microbacterium sp.]MCX6501533.1 MarR family transcriptional regulator [Microbacterium sp.]